MEDKTDSHGSVVSGFVRLATTWALGDRVAAERGTASIMFGMSYMSMGMSYMSMGMSYMSMGMSYMSMGMSYVPAGAGAQAMVWFNHNPQRWLLKMDRYRNET